jgi:hypothetical protein
MDGGDGVSAGAERERQRVAVIVNEQLIQTTITILFLIM